MTDPIFLTLDEVLQIHARSLAEHGGAEGELYLAMIEMAEKKLKKSDLAAIFRKAANPD